MNRVAVLVFSVGLIIGCHDQRSVTSPHGLSADFSDGRAAGGNPHFFFLPPLASQPALAGVFNPNLRPVVDICQLVVDASQNALGCDQTIPTINPGMVQLDPTEQLYQVNWMTGEPAVDLTKFYRIEVRGAPGARKVLGFADIAPVANGSQLRNVNTGQYIGLVDGRTLPIKFRIENGAFCKANPDCGEATIGSGGGTVITSTGLAGALFPPGALSTDVVVTIEVVTERPCLPIDLLQRSGCYQFSTDPGPNTFTQPVTAGICVDIEGLTPAERSLLHLHQLDFIEEAPVVTPLPNVAAHFLTCDAPHPAATPVGLGAGTLERLLALGHQGVRTVAGFLVPQRLLAAHIGVGGLTGSFSRIGWALPAQMTKGAGDGQTAPAGTPVPTPPSVVVKDSSGAPVPGQTVSFSVGSGGGAVAGGSTTTDATGVASPGSWTLGASTGANTLIATSRGAVGSPVTFTATGNERVASHRVSAGWLHACAVTTTGAAYCWGDNTYGELGDGTTAGATAPTAVAGGLTFAAVGAGINFTCGITTAGAAYCWGNNTDGELGNGTTAGATTPVAVSGGLTFVTVTTGARHTCGLTADGAAHCWGGNGNGELGNGTTTSTSTPVPVAGGLTFIQVSAGDDYTCGVTRASAVYCWGFNLFGELGNGTTAGASVPVAVTGGLSFTAVATGAFFACGVTTSGAGYCWGDNRDGELGNGTTAGPQQCLSFSCSTTPVPVLGGLTFLTVTAFAGAAHTCGLTSGSAAYCWGGNFYGDLGFPPPGDATMPAAVSGGLTFVTISTGQTETCGITTSGALYCWGGNFVGQLGIGTSTGPQLCSSSAGSDFPCSPSPAAVLGGLTFATADTGDPSQMAGRWVIVKEQVSVPTDLGTRKGTAVAR